MKKLAAIVLVLWSALVCAAFTPFYVPAINIVSSANIGPTPSFVSVSSNGGGLSANLPAGVANNDLLLIYAVGYVAGSTATGYTTPAGWNLLNSYTLYFLVPGDYTAKVSVFYRFYQTGDPSSVSLTIASGETRYSSFMMAYRNVNISSPFEAFANNNFQSAANPIPYIQITTLGPNRRVLQSITAWTAGNASATPYAGWAQRMNIVASLNTAIDDAGFASAGLTSSGSQSRGASLPWGQMAFALKPTGS